MNLPKACARVAVLAVLLAGVAGCGAETKVTRVDAGVVTDLSGRWNDTDSRMVAESMVKEALEYPWLNNFSQSKRRQPVVVVGYPMGVAGMVAKSPRQVYQRLAFRSDTVSVARELAALALIRPSATYGHLGDIVGDKLIYDAPTAHGGSGGPVFDVEGKVVAVNAAYVDGFAGGTLGISAGVLRDLLAGR